MDALDSKLRQRFAQAGPVEQDETFVARLRQQRGQQRRRSVLLRRLFVGAVLLSAMAALAILAPWLARLVHELDAFVTDVVMGPHSPASMFLLLVVLGASVIAAWAWRWAWQRD